MDRREFLEELAGIGCLATIAAVIGAPIAWFYHNRHEKQTNSILDYSGESSTYRPIDDVPQVYKDMVADYMATRFDARYYFALEDVEHPWQVADRFYTIDNLARPTAAAVVHDRFGLEQLLFFEEKERFVQEDGDYVRRDGEYETEVSFGPSISLPAGRSQGLVRLNGHNYNVSLKEELLTLEVR